MYTLFSKHIILIYFINIWLKKQRYQIYGKLLKEVLAPYPITDIDIFGKSILKYVIWGKDRWNNKKSP